MTTPPVPAPTEPKENTVSEDARRAYDVAVTPGVVGTNEEFLQAQAFALMALCDAAPTWVESVGETPEAAVMSVSDAAVVAARFAIGYRALSRG